MLKKIFCCSMMMLGFSCVNSASADNEGLSNTTYLSAHEVKKVTIGRSFANCKSTTLSERYIGLKTCGSANISDVYYMATGFFHNTATQLFSKKAMRVIENAGIKFSVSYQDSRTSLGLRAHF